MTEVLNQSSGTAERQIISLSQDSFYKELKGDEMELAKKGHFNFDHPGENFFRPLSWTIGSGAEIGRGEEAKGRLERKKNWLPLFWTDRYVG